MTVTVFNAWQIFLKGGPMMWPILILSIAAVAIGINRLVFLRNIDRGLRTDKQLFLESLRQGRLKETLRLCEERASFLGAMVKAGILRFGAPRELIKGAMDEQAGLYSARLREYVDILSLIINTAPLMGLLGTVNAMAVVFHAVQIRSNVLNPLTAGELATGIWQALLTTSAGLVVGIISYAVYGFCVLRINAVILDLEYTSLEMANMLSQLSELKNVGMENGNES